MRKISPIIELYFDLKSLSTSNIVYKNSNYNFIAAYNVKDDNYIYYYKKDIWTEEKMLNLPEIIRFSKLIAFF